MTRQFFPKAYPWPEGVVQVGEALRFMFQSHGSLFPLAPGDYLVTNPNESRYTYRKETPDA